MYARPSTHVARRQRGIRSGSTQHDTFFVEPIDRNVSE
jgi:hypothetical protein